MERLRNTLLSVGVLLALLTSLWTLAVDRTAIKDRTEQNTAEIEQIQAQMVTRREVDDMKDRLERIEGKLDRLIMTNQDVIWVHRPPKKRDGDK